MLFHRRSDLFAVAPGDDVHYAAVFLDVEDIHAVRGKLLLRDRLRERRLDLEHASLHAVKFAVEHYLPAVEKSHTVAEFVYFPEIVGAENYSQLGIYHSVDEHLLDDYAHSGVKPVESLVKEQIRSSARDPAYHRRLPLHTL